MSGTCKEIKCYDGFVEMCAQTTFEAIRDTDDKNKIMEKLSKDCVEKIHEVVNKFIIRKNKKIYVEMDKVVDICVELKEIIEIGYLDYILKYSVENGFVQVHEDAEGVKRYGLTAEGKKLVKQK